MDLRGMERVQCCVQNGRCFKRGDSHRRRQERTCDDINRCQPSRLEYQPCKFNIPISMRTVELCNENYIEIYDLQKNMLVSRLKESELQGVVKLDIRLATVNLTGYCDYCYNKIKDYDE